MSKKRLRLTVHGTCYGEQISFGVSARGDDQFVLFDLASANSFLGQAEPDTQTFLTSVGPYLGNAVQWQGIKVRYYDSSGVMQTLAERTFATPVNGTNGSIMPGYVACCVTTLSDTPGRRGRGRFYLPITTSYGLNGSRLSASAIATIQGAAKTWLSNLDNAPGFDALVSGFKTVIYSNVLNGATYDIKRVRVGDVLDLQRRRYNEQIETYSTGTLT